MPPTKKGKIVIHAYRYSQFASCAFNRAESRYLSHHKLESINQVREDILKEIICIESQMMKTTNKGNSADFSMRQTWKEMVGTRKFLLKQLAISLD